MPCSYTVLDQGNLTSYFFFQAEDGIRDYKVTGVQTCALPIYPRQEIDQLPDLGGDRDLARDLEQLASLLGRQDPLAADVGPGLGRHVLHELLQLGGGHRGRRRRQEAAVEPLDARVRVFEVGGDLIAPREQIHAAHEQALALGHQVGGGGALREERADHEEPAEDERHHRRAADDDHALAGRDLAEPPDHWRMPPGGAVGPGRRGGVGAPAAPGTTGGTPGTPGPGAGAMIAGPVAAEPGGGVTAP